MELFAKYFNKRTVVSKVWIPNKTKINIKNLDDFWLKKTKKKKNLDERIIAIEDKKKKKNTP